MLATAERFVRAQPPARSAVGDRLCRNWDQSKRPADLRTALLAPPGPASVGTILQQLLLIVLWHPVIFALARTATAESVVFASKFWHEPGLASTFTNSVSPAAATRIPAHPRRHYSLFVIRYWYLTSRRPQSKVQDSCRAQSLAIGQSTIRPALPDG